MANLAQVVISGIPSKKNENEEGAGFTPPVVQYNYYK
jgi:hypothetical protein